MKTSLCLLFASLFLLPTPVRAATDSAAALFNSTTLRTLHLTLTPDQYKAVQPTTQRRQPGGGGFMRRMEYPVVHATVEFQGKTYNDVAVRYKGNSSFMMARNSLKKSLKLEFGKFVEGQSFFGLSTVNLNNNAGDPSGSRETLAYELFAASGVPACRTTLLRVELSVPGEFDHQLLGLYTLVEEVNKKFLKSRLGESKGLLLKPDMARDLPLQGDDW
jgi:spore coat protein CotH